MNSALLGLGSALGLGVADFMGRFSARALGATLTYGAVLFVGAAVATFWLLASEQQLIWSPIGCAIAVAHGICVSVMCILLYMGMARGPIAVVAPIVAAHPVLVLGVNVLMDVRPSALQWAAMASIVVGGLIIARGAVADSDGPQGESNWRSVLIASGACVAYAALVLTGQAAAPLIGEFQTMWIGRCSGLVFIAVILVLQRPRARIPKKWMPYLGLQGLLDTAGYFTFLAGANTAAPHITMVVASAFSVVTVLLAWLVIHEPVSKMQWGAIALIAAGTAILSAT